MFLHLYLKHATTNLLERENFMKIAIVLEQELHDGGGFQYALSMIELLNAKRTGPYEWIILTNKHKNLEILQKYTIPAQYFSFGIHHRLASYARKFAHLKWVSAWDKTLDAHHIDLVYFLAPSYFALFTFQHNYIFTVWDLCHRDFPEFPEVGWGRNFQQRENLFHKALPKAVAIVVDSVLGKENLVRRYAVDPDRVVVLPFLPGEHSRTTEQEYQQHYISIPEKYKIPGPYIFYPAQFWPHKNHIYILEALKILKEQLSTKVNAVFCGADHGNLQHILNDAERLNIRDQVFYLGLVANQEMPYLYRQALALVMPTYFGPTNIPPLEAFALGCPVIYSDLPGLRDQVGDAGLLVDLANPASLVDQLQKILRHDPSISQMIALGHAKLAQNTPEHQWQILEKILQAYEIKQKCWR